MLSHQLTFTICSKLVLVTYLLVHEAYPTFVNLKLTNGNEDIELDTPANVREVANLKFTCSFTKLDSRDTIVVYESREQEKGTWLTQTKCTLSSEGVYTIEQLAAESIFDEDSIMCEDQNFIASLEVKEDTTPKYIRCFMPYVGGPESYDIHQLNIHQYFDKDVYWELSQEGEIRMDCELNPSELYTKYTWDYDTHEVELKGTKQKFLKLSKSDFEFVTVGVASYPLKLLCSGKPKEKLWWESRLYTVYISATQKASSPLPIVGTIAAIAGLTIVVLGGSVVMVKYKRRTRNKTNLKPRTKRASMTAPLGEGFAAKKTPR